MIQALSKVEEIQETLHKVRDFGANMISTAEWLADFVSTSVRAESRHFTNVAITAATEHLIGFRQPGPRKRPDECDLEPLAGISIHPPR
jgi:hypothetical protein